MIKHEGSKWVLYNKEGTKVLGEHPTEAEAIAQERAIEASKQRKDGVMRFDLGGLEKPVKMDNGWRRVDGYLTRTGVFHYQGPDGSTVREYRPPEEVFKPESVATFSLVPLTNEHPPAGLLTADNTKTYQVGTVETPKHEGKFLRANILVTDAAAIAALDGGKTQLSCGYLCDLDDTPGEIEGEKYDCIQRNIRGNHVALVDTARAGPEARVRMDNAGAAMVAFETPSDSTANRSEENMAVKIKFDGVAVEVSEEVAKAIETERASQAEALKGANAKVETESARADAAQAEVAKLKAELAKAPEQARAAAEARLALEAQAKKILGDEKFDGVSDAILKTRIAEKVLGVKLDGKSEIYIEASFDLALKNAEKSDESKKALEGTEKIDASDTVSKARAAFDAALFNRSAK